MKIKQPINSSKKEDRIIYKGELWKGDFFAWVKHRFTRQRPKRNALFAMEKKEFRLISHEAFCVKDFRDVKLNFLPKIGDKIKVEGISGVYQIIRQSNQAREFEILRGEEGLEHTSVFIAEEYLREKYPYLLSSSDIDYHRCILLEVTEIMNSGD